MQPVKRSKDGQPVRYLIVDDSVFARKNLARMVETFGGQIAGEAGDGLTAISEFDRTHPDIVLMDITMPQMEGIEAAEKIVQQHPEARIVMVSSVGYQENIVAALQRGARHFVQKPVKPEVLYEVIKYVLGRRRRRGRRRWRRSLSHEDGVDPAVHQRGGRRVVARPAVSDARWATSPWKRKPIAAKALPRMIALTGDIEGRIIFDLAPKTASSVASHLRRHELPESDASDPRNRLRTRQPGHGQCRLGTERSGISFPRSSPGAAHFRTGRPRAAKIPKPGDLLRDLPRAMSS